MFWKKKTTDRTVHHVHSGEFSRVMEGKPEATLLDLRTPEEYSAGHMPGARMIDTYAADFDAKLDGLDRDSPYLIYCRTGSRSGEVARMMERKGFKEVYNLTMGLLEWRYPLETGMPGRSKE